MLDGMTLGLVGLGIALAVIHRHLLVAAWFRLEDPRPVALFRIALGALLLCWLVDLAPLYDYLFSSEGLFTAAQRRARVFRGPRLSLLLWVDSPTVVAGYVGVMGLSTLALTVGLATRVASWVTLVLLLGLMARNPVFLGGEQVFGSFLFLLCLSRCGHAYSIDQWWRRRRHGDGAIRSIPAWPRILMLLQTIPLFCANGLAKSGSMWAAGDTFYYFFNHPHFRPGSVWGISAVLGTNVFRVMTWVTHGFEILCPLVIVGLVWRFARARPELLPGGRVRWVGRVLATAIGAGVIGLALLKWPGEARSRMPFVLACGAGVVIGLSSWVPGRGRIPMRGLVWVIGRRVWIPLLVTFTGMLFIGTRVGWFTGIAMFTAVLFFDGEEIGRVLRSRRPPMPAGPWSPSRRIRGVVVGVCVVHIVAIAVQVLPRGPDREGIREAVERPLRFWTDNTTGPQLWRMFAPNGSSTAVDLRVSIVDSGGEAHDVGSGLVPVERVESAWGRDKREKVRRRVAGRRSGKLYRPAHVRFVCRHYRSRVGPGAVVEITAVSVPIVPPEVLAELGVEASIDWMRARRQDRVVHREACEE